MPPAEKGNGWQTIGKKKEKKVSETKSVSAYVRLIILV